MLVANFYSRQFYPKWQIRCDFSVAVATYDDPKRKKRYYVCEKTQSDAFLDSRHFMQKYQTIWNVDLASFLFFFKLGTAPDDLIGNQNFNLSAKQYFPFWKF